jgi:hypothetical protein
MSNPKREEILRRLDLIAEEDGEEYERQARLCRDRDGQM